MALRPLKNRNVTIDGRRTSLRLEHAMWDALKDISQRECTSIGAICSLLRGRLDQEKQAGRIRPDEAVTLSSAVRVFVTTYYRSRIGTREEIREDRGALNLFSGTPFEAENSTV